MSTVEEAVEAIRAGGVVGVPTDTVYGLAVDPFDEDALWALFDLKGRPQRKPIGLLVGSVGQASELAEIPEDARGLLAEHWPGALTIVVPVRVVVPDWVGDRSTRTIGLRMPAHASMLELLRQTGPLAVTSANRSGQAETRSDVEARAVFGDEVDAYLTGECPGGQASTVISFSAEGVKVLRRGPVDVDAFGSGPGTADAS